MIDVETPIRKYLEYNNIDNVYEEKFPVKRINDIEVLIARDGSGMPVPYIEIDAPRIRVEVRANSLADSRNKIIEIINLLHRLQNQEVHGLYIYWSMINGGPALVIDPATGEETHTAYFILKTREG